MKKIILDFCENNQVFSQFCHLLLCLLFFETMKHGGFILQKLTTHQKVEKIDITASNARRIKNDKHPISLHIFGERPATKAMNDRGNTNPPSQIFVIGYPSNKNILNM